MRQANRPLSHDLRKMAVPLLPLALLALSSDCHALATEAKTKKKIHAQALPPNYQKVKQAGAELYKAQRFADAEPFFQKGLRIIESQEKRFDDEHVAILLDLSETYYKLRRPMDAQRYSKKAIDLVKEKFGKDSSKLPALLSYDATLYPKTSSHREAQLKEALRISEPLVGKDSPSLLHLLSNIHTMHEGTAAGIPYGLRIYEMRRRIPSFKTNGNSFNICGYLALDYMAAGDFKSAETLAKESEQISSKLFGETSRPLWASTLLAICYEKLGKTDIATKQIEKCTSGFKSRNVDDGHFWGLIVQCAHRFSQYEMYEPALELATTAVDKAKANPDLADPQGILTVEFFAIQTACNAGKKDIAKTLYSTYQSDISKLYKAESDRNKQLEPARKLLLASGLTGL